MHNPMLPSTDPCLNLGEKTSAEKLLPIRPCVKAQRFLFHIYYHKFISIYQLIILMSESPPPIQFPAAFLAPGVGRINNSTYSL